MRQVDAVACAVLAGAVQLCGGKQRRRHGLRTMRLGRGRGEGKSDRSERGDRWLFHPPDGLGLVAVSARDKHMQVKRHKRRPTAKTYGDSLVESDVERREESDGGMASPT